MDFRIEATYQDNSETVNLDLYGDLDISVIFNISDIREPESRKTNYTRNISLPATKRNNRFFDGIIEAGWSPTNFNPNLNISAALYRDDEKIIEGYLQLTDIVKKADYMGGGIDEYNVTIYGDLFTFFSNLSDTEISDIDFSEYNHLWTRTNIIGSWNEFYIKNNAKSAFQLGEGYVYPMEWRGQTNYDFEVEDFYPAFYVKTIWDKIFNYVGSTYSSNFLNSEKFRRLIIPFTKDRLYLPDEVKKDREFEVETNIKDTVYPPGCPADEYGQQLKMFMYATVANTYNNIPLRFNNETSDPFDLWVQNRFFEPNFTGEQSMNLDAVINTVYRLNGSCPTTQFLITGPNNKLKIKLWDFTDNKLVAEKDYEVIHPTGINLGQTNVAVNIFWSYTDTFIEGHKYGYLMDYTVPEGPNSSKFVTSIGQVVDCRMDTYLLPGSKVFNAIGDYLFEGDNITINQALPEMSAKDFITSINKMFNLYWLQREDGTIKIEPRDEFYTGDDVEVLDWTEKVDRNSDITIKPLSELTNKEYLFTYQEDDDYYNTIYNDNYNEVYGTKKIMVNNDFVEGKYDIGIEFSTSPLINLNNEPFRIVPAYVQYENGYYERYTPNIRIHIYGGLLDCDDWAFRSKLSSDITNSKYPYAGHLDNPLEPTYDILWNNPNLYYFEWNYKTNDNLYNNYWYNTIQDITNQENHMLTCKMYHKQYDITTINLFDTIQVDSVNYIINKVEYNPITMISDVELIKLSTQNIKNKKKKSTGGGTTTWTNGGQTSTWKDKKKEKEATTKVKTKTDGEKRGGTTYWKELDRLRKVKRINWVERNKHRKTAVNNWNDVRGNENNISESASYVSVWGDGNLVSSETSHISIQGNNNIVKSGLRNVKIIGNETIATKSDTTYINGVEISKDEGVIEGGSNGWLYSGGVNEVYNPFGNTSLITNIIAGIDTVQMKGGFNSINLLNCGVDTNNDPNEKPL